MRVKCRMQEQGEVRLLSAPIDVPIARLRQLLAEEFGLQADQMVIQYEDEENDTIIIKTQSDLDERILQAVRLS